MPRLELEYFAQLRDEAGRSRETRETTAATAADLYTELQTAYGFTLPANRMRVAINAAFQPWTHPLTEGDMVVFIPPVTGG